MKLFIFVCVAAWCISISAFGQSTANGQFGPPAGGVGNGNGQAPAAAPASDALFSAIDTDGDGEITTRELRKAVASLKKLDVDKDGKITRAETLHNQVATSGAGMQQGFGSQPPFAGVSGGVNGDPRQGPNMMQFDRNGDSRITSDEIPQNMRGMMRDADQNGNGQLDPAEVLLIQQRVNERVRGQRPLPPGVSVGPQGVKGVGEKP